MFSNLFSKPHFLSSFLSSISNQWNMLIITCAVITFLLVLFYSKKIIFYFLKKYIQSPSPSLQWTRSLIKGINQLIWAVTAFFVFRWFFEEPKIPIFKIWISASFIWILYALVSPFSLWIKKVWLTDKNREYSHLFSFLEKTLKVFVFLAGGVFIIQNMGFNVSSVLAGLGLGGMAIAFAAKETLSNIFGSLMIAFDRPFSLGDWIQFDNIEGTVENIGIRSTQIKTFYDSIVSIPNSVIAQSKIDNLGKRQFRRTRFTLGVTYSTPSIKIQNFVEGIKTIIQKHPKTKKDYYQVSFSGYADSSLNIFVNLFLQVKDWNEELDCRQEIFLDILNLAQKENVEFAFPSQSLYIERMKSYSKI